MKAAIVIHNKEDYIMLHTGYKIGLEEVSFSEFMQEVENSGDFSEWDSYYRWDEEFDNFEKAVQELGTLLCYVNDENELVVLNEKLFEEKSSYYEELIKQF